MSHESASSSAKTTTADPKTSHGTVATTPAPTTRTWAPTTHASTTDASTTIPTTTHSPTTHASTTHSNAPTTQALTTTNASATRAPMTQVPTPPTFTPHSYILTSSNGLECLKLYTALQFSIKYEVRHCAYNILRELRRSFVRDEERRFSLILNRSAMVIILR